MKLFSGEISQCIEMKQFIFEIEKILLQIDCEIKIKLSKRFFQVN